MNDGYRFVEADHAISEHAREDVPVMINVRNISFVTPHYKWKDVSTIFLTDGRTVDVRGTYDQVAETFRRYG